MTDSLERVKTELERGHWDEDWAKDDIARLVAEVEQLRQKAAGLDVEHETQRQMIVRLGIDWTPGEPFYSLVEAEIKRLTERALYAEKVWKELGVSREKLQAELEQLRYEVDSLRSDRLDMQDEIKQLQHDHELDVAALNGVTAENDSLREDRDRLTRIADNLINERDAAWTNTKRTIQQTE